MWEAYRWRIVGGVSLIVFQSVLITTLLLQRKRRRMAEQNLRISEAHRQTAVLEERNRMARDIHDTLAQGFTGVIVQLEAAKSAFANGSSAEGEEHNRRAAELARQSLGEARRSVKALRPEVLEQEDLWIALDGLIKRMTAGRRLSGDIASSRCWARGASAPSSWPTTETDTILLVKSGKRALPFRDVLIDNAQLTDGGPSATPESTVGVAGPPFGAASGSAIRS